MNVIEVGRHAIAVTSSGILALLLSDCAIRSSPAVPPSPSNAGTAATGNQIFKYTGKKQTFTVPRGVTMLTIAAYGASGGSIGSYAGGRGALVKAKIPVTPEESLSVFVGASGRIGSRRAFNGGGAGAGTRHHHSSGGGGASDVRLDTGVRILIAGGGGGAGAASGEHLHRDPALRSAFTGYGQGGDGGGKVADSGSEGAFGYYRAAGGDGGGGGSQTTGGSGGNGGSSSGSCSGRTGGSGARHVGGAGGSACYAGGAAGAVACTVVAVAAAQGLRAALPIMVNMATVPGVVVVAAAGDRRLSKSRQRRSKTSKARHHPATAELRSLGSAQRNRPEIAPPATIAPTLDPGS
jgi:hypothetical protein